jgi:hypothetical protein
MVVVGLLFLTLVVLGLEELMLLGQARGFVWIGLLYRDVGFLGARGVGTVGVGYVSLGIDVLIYLVGVSGERECEQGAGHEGGGPSGEPGGSLGSGHITLRDYVLV